MDKIREYFSLKERNTDLRTECIAGITAFLTVSYGFLLIPAIMSRIGISFSSAYFSVMLAFSVANIYLGISTDLPLLLRPSIVVAVYYAYIVVLSVGATCYEGTAVLVFAGVSMVVMSLSGWREKIVSKIPAVLRIGITAGIGLMMLILGLRLGKIIVSSPFALAAVGDIVNPVMFVSLLGLVITTVFCVNKIKGAVLWGMLISGAVSYELDYIADLPGLFKIPVGLEKLTWGISLENFDRYVFLCIVILLTAIFESSAVIIGNDFTNKSVRAANKADSVGTLFSACLGMVPMVFSPEARIVEICRGKTGVVPLVAGILGMVMIFCEPVMCEIAEMPAVFVPALIITGAGLLIRLKETDTSDMANLIPVFVMLTIMAVTSNIAAGIGSGVILYVLLRSFSGRSNEITKELYLLAVLFLGYYMYMLI